MADTLDISNARARAEAIARAPHAPKPPPPTEPSDASSRRWFAIGDPQSSFDNFATVLAARGLLAADGSLQPDVGLVSIGDHFDYGSAGDDVATSGREGSLVLGWLAAHAIDQVVILAGNHDLARVQELASETDASFAAARALGAEIRLRRESELDVAELIEVFHQRFPAIPTPELAARDYSSFTESQRAQVQRLLLKRRMRLACAATTPDGTPLLLSHAGVTLRDLEHLGVPGARSPGAIACALDDALDERTMRVELPWESGKLEALDLEPLHAAGTTGREGGGLCYHRPAHPGRPGANLAWEFDDEAPRRFDPRTLPVGMVQACGHSGHPRCCKELFDWVDPAANTGKRGGMRTLTTDGTSVHYALGIAQPRPGQATLYFIDGELDYVEPASYELLPLGTVATGVTSRMRR